MLPEKINRICIMQIWRDAPATHNSWRRHRRPLHLHLCSLSRSSPLVVRRRFFPLLAFGQQNVPLLSLKSVRSLMFPYKGRGGIQFLCAEISTYSRQITQKKTNTRAHTRCTQKARLDWIVAGMCGLWRQISCCFFFCFPILSFEPPPAEAAAYMYESAIIDFPFISFKSTNNFWL